MGKLPKLGEDDVFAGEYRIVKTLAEGSLGSLHEAVHEKSGERRALKLLPPDVVAEPARRERFEKDACPGARVAGELSMEVLASGVDEETGAPWLATELPGEEQLERFVEKMDPNRAALSALLGASAPESPFAAAAPPEQARSRAPREAQRQGPRGAAQGKKGGSGVGAGVVLAAVVGLGVLAGAGVAAYKFFQPPSLSETPCGQGTLALIGSLRSPVTITFYVTKGLPKMDQLALEVSAMMRDLEQASKGKLVYNLAEITNESVAAEAKAVGLQETVFGDSDKPGESVTIRRGYCGLAFSYGSEHEAIPVLSPEQGAKGLPFWIVGKIRELRGRADGVSQRFGVVAGKGGVTLSEPSLMAKQPGRSGGPNMKGIFEQSLPYYKFEDVDLRGGEAEIDGGYLGVLVLQPDTDFTDKELRRIDQFLMRGKKSVVVIASAVGLKPGDAKMAAGLDTHGLDRLLGGYGIDLQKDAVFDSAQATAISITTASGSAAQLKIPGIPLVKHDDAAAPDAQTLDTSFVPFFRLDEVAFPFASTLALHPDKQPGARLFPVARSSPSAAAETHAPFNFHPMAEAVPRPDPKQRILAAALEGKIRSAFAGRPGDGVSAPETAPEASRLLVIASSQFLVNPFARAANPPPAPPEVAMLGGGPPADEDLALLSQMYAQKYLTTTILAFKNTLDWASADDATVACSALLSDSAREAREKDKK
jgi:ABC-type uncharacterized transport system involved in gliding motility auxiliary subunit